MRFMGEKNETSLKNTGETNEFPYPNDKRIVEINRYISNLIEKNNIKLSGSEEL